LILLDRKFDSISLNNRQDQKYQRRVKNNKFWLRRFDFLRPRRRQPTTTQMTADVVGLKNLRWENPSWKEWLWRLDTYRI
jgi:hypothetical protein